MNVVCLAGNLGMDPEMKYTQNGGAILRMRLATSERRKRGEQWEDHTEWHTIIVFGNRAEGLNKILDKGAKVAVTGRIQHRQWEDKDGNRRTSTEVVANDVTLQGGKRQARSAPDDPQSGPDFGDDDVPFRQVGGRLV